MSNSPDPTVPSSAALVTGATSGLGYETATQLAAAGHDPVVVTGRTEARAAEAATNLATATGRDVFVPLALDLGDPADVARAAEELVSHGRPLQVVILNAGIVAPPNAAVTVSQEDLTYASSLTGHHRLTMALLAADALTADARIVIAGSEAATGGVPLFNPVGLDEVAARFDGDRLAAATSLIRGTSGRRYKPGEVYATAKLFVAWWAQALSRRLPAGMTVNAVSPGSVPDTQAIRNANFAMRRIMVPIMKLMPRSMGMSHTVADGAARYLEVAGRGPTVSGRFFASPSGKVTGPVTEVVLDLVKDTDQAEAAWRAVVNVTGFDAPAADRRPVDKRVR